MSMVKLKRPSWVIALWLLLVGASGVVGNFVGWVQGWNSHQTMIAPHLKDTGEIMYVGGLVVDGVAQGTLFVWGSGEAQLTGDSLTPEQAQDLMKAGELGRFHVIAVNCNGPLPGLRGLPFGKGEKI